MTTELATTTPSFISSTEKNRALLSQVLETKLTRTELMDLIIERIRDDLRKERDELQAKMEKLDRTLKLPAALKLLKTKAKEARVKLEEETEHRRVGFEYKNQPVHYTLSISVTLPLDTVLPPKYVEAHAEYDRLETKLNEVQKKLNRLENGKTRARNELVRHALDSTPEGKNIMDAIVTLTESVKARLVEKPSLSQ